MKAGALVHVRQALMAFGRGGKMDGRRPSSSSSSSFCTTTTVVLFVALCLVGAWMMTSSTVFPLEISSNKKPVVKQQPAPVNFGASQEASPGIAGEGSEKFEDTDNNDATVPEEPNKQDASEQENFNEKPEEKELEVPVEKAETKDMFDDANGKSEGLSDETKNDDGEKSVEKKDDEITNESGDEKTDGESKDGQEEKPDGDATQEEQPKIEENVGENGEKDQSSNSNEVFPDGAQSELLKESNTQNGSFPTQAAESKNEKEVQALPKSSGDATSYTWKLCNSSASTDYIPCLDNEKAIKKLRTTKHYEHRERHCPEEPPTCLVPLPEGYKRPIEWPKSRDKVILFILNCTTPNHLYLTKMHVCLLPSRAVFLQVWYSNVPHTRLAEYKGHQNWVKVSGDYLLFPGGGTQFKNGALHYIDTIQQVYYRYPSISY